MRWSQKAKICPTCKKVFMVKKSHYNRRRFCSFKCKAKWMETLTVEKALNWQGGKDDKSERIRRRLNYKLWRKAILERDKFCQMCGSTKHLQAHHIISVKEDKTKICDLNNGIALCKWCHHMTHSPKVRPEGTTINERNFYPNVGESSDKRFES